MPNIRVERAPVGPFFLGYFGFDHLNLAFEPDSLTGVPVPQDEWFVMEGVRSVTLSGPVLAVLGATGNMTLRIANGAVGGDELVAEIGTPETRGSHILNVPVPETTWASMASHALDIQDTQFRYTAYGLSASVNPPLNSTSFIASLMHLAGIDFATNAPRGLRLSPGSETLLGTYDNDIFSLDERINSVFSGYGEDTLQGIHNTSRIDRLYGGGDNDMFLWSRGVDFIHGGDRSLRYADDGIDTIDFSGAGNVHIILVSANSPEHVTPDYVAYHGGHAVWMFSIERLIWNGDGTDNITTGPGLELVEIPLTMDLGGDSGDPRGDELSFEETTDGITVNAGTDTAHFIQSTGAGGPGGWWVESVEWIHGSSGNDRIYTNSELRGIEGGIGDDLIDARLISAFAGTSPEGYDIEIYGGEGSDTIVSGLGITYADGGDGSDTFVLAGLSESSGATIEFIIENADSGDSLVVPYNYFNGSGAGFDGSELMPVLGAIGTMTQLQDGELLYYEHRTWQQATFGNDESDGVIQFIGLIEFELVGNDLLIHFYSGETAVETFVIDDLGNTETYTSVLSSGESHTIVRVVDFQEGDLGLQFLDPGESVDLQIGPDFYAFQPNWDSAVGALNAGFEPALEERPIGPTSDPNALDQSPPTPRTPSTGTPAPDLISYDEPVAVDAGDGDDTIVGSGNSNDVLNGGSGADHMEGAGGDDTYVVDNAGDFVVETVLGGRDDVISLIDYTLPDEVEDLTLAGDARLGVGNELGNRMTGSDGDDQLSGLDGADSLVGGLGDDLLIGGSGNDNYFYHRGEGRDEIIDNGTSATEIDTLYLFGDILPNEVTAYRLQSSPNDLVLAFAGGGTIVITGFYDDPTHGIDRIFFSDGTTWTRQEIDALAASAPLLDNAAPDAHDDPGLIYGGTDYIVPAELLLANDRDHDGDALTIISVSNVSAGTASIDANGDVVLAPPPGFEGQISFTYEVSDGNGGTSTATVEMTIVPNTAPTATATIEDQQASAGTAWSYTLPANLFVDVDFDLVSVTITLADGSPLPEWLSYDWVTQTLSGTPPAGTQQSLDIMVRAFDGFVPTDVTFNLEVAASGNVAPVAADDGGFATLAGVPLVISTPLLLANDSDGNGDSLTIVSVGAAVGGTVSLGLFGTIAFTPSAGFVGLASFEYVVSDGNGGTATATATIDVQAVGTTITGSSADEVLAGTSGNDIFAVLGNNQGFDVYHGGDGLDVVQGSPYNDTFGLANDPTNLAGIEAIAGGSGNDTIRLTSGDDALDLSAIAVSGVELIDAQAGNDTITGSASADIIRGGAGNDVIDGGDGDDTFTIVGGAEGSDVFRGGGGFDTILGSAYNDIIGLANDPTNL
ncbi:MAG: cadherin-like domain-containing protein, partial [Hyphomicrobiaceae bacterium]|nr:cadherin-like domain-containing protein [Hyphomicrobiaceae bacterium]